MATLVVGCGFLGLEVARRCVAAGEDVHATTRSTARAADFARSGIVPVVADVLHPASLANLPQVDRVFYAVGFDRSSGASMRDVYVQGLQNVLAALAGKTSRLVYASSTGVYSQHDGGWVDEDSPAEPTTESGRVCLDAENIARGWAAANDVSLTVLRYAGLYGPGRVVRRQALEAGEPIAADPDSYLNMIHVDDAASAAVAALTAGSPGPLYLVCDDGPLPRGEYYRKAATLLGAPPPVFVKPVPGPSRGRGDSNKRVSNRRVKAELGISWTYPDVASGLIAALQPQDREP